MKSIRTISIRIITHIKQFGKQAVRKVASSLGIGKSSVHRLQKAIKRRNKYPESHFWETEAGSKWLFILVLAALYVFGLKSNVGADRLSEFFKIIRIHHHVGVSPASVRTMLNKMESKIAQYEQIHGSKKAPAGSRAVVSPDEVFFGGVPHLVMLDLVSGFIMVEESAEDRSYDTWIEAADKPIKSLGIEVIHTVSDRAPGLIRMALVGFGCQSGADIFHSMRDISKWLGKQLSSQKRPWEKKLIESRNKLKKLQKSSRSEHKIKKEEAKFKVFTEEHKVITAEQDKYLVELRNISTAVHPFDMDSSCVQSSEQAKEKLEKCAQTFEDIALSRSISKAEEKLKSFRKHFNDMCSIIDIWWVWVFESLVPFNLNSSRLAWITGVVLPPVYWYRQMNKTDNPRLKVEYTEAWEGACYALKSSLSEVAISKEELDHWTSWADGICGYFHRSSSAVEGRNGRLAQMYHNGRGLSPKRLKTSTVIHNYDTRRKDGTTPAERLFKCEFPQLFGWILENMDELPLARRGKKRAIYNPLNL